MKQEWRLETQFQKRLREIVRECAAEMALAQHQHDEEIRMALDDLERGIKAHTRLAS